MQQRIHGVWVFVCAYDPCNDLYQGQPVWALRNIVCFAISSGSFN